MFLLKPRPLPFTPTSDLENQEFNCTLCFLAPSNGIQTPVASLQNVQAHAGPYEVHSGVPPWEESRGYTDRIMLRGYYNELRSGLRVVGSFPDGSQKFYTVKDVNQYAHGDITECLCQSELDGNII